MASPATFPLNLLHHSWCTCMSFLFCLERRKSTTGLPVLLAFLNISFNFRRGGISSSTMAEAPVSRKKTEGYLQLAAAS